MYNLVPKNLKGELLLVGSAPPVWHGLHFFKINLKNVIYLCISILPKFLSSVFSFTYDAFPSSPGGSALCAAELLLLCVCVCASTMASLLRVLAAGSSAPVLSGVSCLKLQHAPTIKTTCVRFFRINHALGRCASPGSVKCQFLPDLSSMKYEKKIHLVDRKWN